MFSNHCAINSYLCFLAFFSEGSIVHQRRSTSKRSNILKQLFHFTDQLEDSNDYFLILFGRLASIFVSSISKNNLQLTQTVPWVTIAENRSNFYNTFIYSTNVYATNEGKQSNNQSNTIEIRSIILAKCG